MTSSLATFGTHAIARNRRRRGMALLVVLLLLSLTLGLSYAAMRSLSTVGMIQRNSDRLASARQAAMTGLTMALKKMHRSDWTGVDTSLNGSLNSTDSFLVTYTTGDPRLSASDSEQPYRVTLLSTGYSVDPDQPQAMAIYRVRGVMRLIPRQLADEPTNWSTMTSYTLYQWTSGYFWMMAPARIEGPVRLRTILDFNRDYYWWGDPRDRFHKDLEEMRKAGRGDYRPFSGPVTLPQSWQWWDTVQALRDYLGLSLIDASMSSGSGLTFPSTLSTYRLYPGGKLYSVPQLPRTIQSSVYQPDAATNPLGLFVRLGALDIGDDTTIRGTVVTTFGSGSRICILGKRVALEAWNLPPLQGTTEPVQLPVAVVGDSFQVGPDADTTVTGLISTYNDFEVRADNHADINLTHQGKLIAQNVYFNGRSDWYKTTTWWNIQYAAFYAQKGNVNGVKYFPEWLKTTQGLDPKPRLTIKPDASSVRYHWHNPQNTIYVANPSDGGLRWDLLDWSENL